MARYLEGKVAHKMCKIVVLVIPDENTGCAELKFFTVSHLIKMYTNALTKIFFLSLEMAPKRKKVQLLGLNFAVTE